MFDRCTSTKWAWLASTALAAAVVSVPVTAQDSAPGQITGAGPSGAIVRAPGGTKPFTSTEMQEIQKRFALAQEIVSSVSSEAKARGLSDSWRSTTINMLLGMNSSALTKLKSTGGYDATISSATKYAKGQSFSTKAFGDIASDLVYVSVTPCRLIDTRNVVGKINGSRGYDLDVLGNPYGGAAGCNIETMLGIDEDSIGAFLFNVTIVDPSAAPGFVAVRPTGTTTVTSLVNWYEAGASVQNSNAAILPGANSGNGLGGNVNAFDIVTSTAVHVIVDFFGAFVRPEATALQCSRVGTSPASGTVSNGGVYFVDAPACPTGYSRIAIGCAYNGTAPNGLDVAEIQLEEGVFLEGCLFRNNSGVTQNATPLRAQANCCRVPGR